MKTVTQTFLDNQLLPDIQVIRSVSYKRRYYSAATNRYTWESNWTSISESKVVDVQPITTQLDTTTLNEYKISNLTITLENFRNEWKPDNPYGYFGPDSASTVYGYEPYLMKFRIQSGLIYPDGTQELVTLFTGVVTELNFNSNDGTVQITVSGEQTLLQNANAEAVSTTSTNENIGTGNGSTKDFFTAQNGVGIIKAVYVAGVLKRAGKDYTIAQLNDASNPAKISFVAAPAAAAAITTTYIYWQQLQKFETLVAELATQSGIAGGNQQISPVTYPNSIINTHNWQTQSQWQAGSVTTYIDTTSIPDSIQALQTPAWNSAATGWTTALTAGTWQLAGSGTGMAFHTNVGHGFNGLVYRANVGAYGTWQVQYEWITGGGGSFGGPQWYFYINALNGGGTDISNGYAIVLDNVTNKIYLFRVDTGTAHQLGSHLMTGGGFGTHTIKVNRAAGGLFTVSFDSVVQFTVTDNNYTTCNYYGYFQNNNNSGTASADNVIWDIANLLIATTPTGIAEWASDTVDFGSTPTSWTNFLYNQTLNGGTVIYYTRSSADGVSWDAWVAVTANVIGSTLRRYMQARADLDVTAGGNPVVSLITIGSVTSSTVITLANFTGQSCYQAIQQIAELANYEFGFDSAENFFFRPRILNSASMSLSSTDFIQAVLSTQMGNDLVYTAIRATYGSYTSEVDDPGFGIEQPSLRIGYALLEPSGGNLLVSADADIATGVAQSFFNYYQYPRRKFKIAVKYLPQVDLSDVLTITFADNLGTGWYWGDSDAYYGDPSIYYYGASEQSIYNLNCKVVGQRIDTENWTCELDLEEVLS